MNDHPSHASFGILYRRRKKQIRILLVQEKCPKGAKAVQWKLAGGKSEEGENDPRRTLIRELKEKVFLQIGEQGIGDVILRLPLRLHAFIAYAIAIGTKHVPQMNPKEVIKIQWFYRSEIEYLITHDRVVSYHVKALKQFFSAHV